MKAKAYTKHPEYSVWTNMKRRCRERTGYADKGVKVCDRWLESFDNFIEDMGKRPAGYTLDRIDSTGNYEPSNCRWADSSTQAKNRSTAVLITFRGKTMNAVDWAREAGISKELLHYRLKAGWSIERALS